MIQLSAVIITFNEEKNIGRCLDSLIGVADDVVVLDSFSTDRTEEICREKGARFIQHKFDGHIEQKNRAITHAMHPYVLSLDADEALDDMLNKSILAVKNDWKYDGYTMNRLTNYCGKWIRYSGWYPDVKLRLWDSRKGHWTGINPHDRYELFEKQKTGHLKGNILHYSYYSMEDHFKQIEYFTSIAAKAAFDKGLNATWIQLYMNPLAKFFKSYFLQLGFLDGKEGFRICWHSSRATHIKYRKLLSLYKTRK